MTATAVEPDVRGVRQAARKRPFVLRRVSLRLKYPRCNQLSLRRVVLLNEGHCGFQHLLPGVGA